MGLGRKYLNATMLFHSTIKIQTTSQSSFFCAAIQFELCRTGATTQSSIRLSSFPDHTDFYHFNQKEIVKKVGKKRNL